MVEPVLEANVVKSGECCIQTTLSRRNRRHGDPPDWKGGLLITVKTLPRVEEFMQSLGSGEVVDVGVVGRHWQAIGGQPLHAYIIQNINTHPGDDGSMVSLDKLGSPLLLMDPERGEKYPTINLSFLRLRGISEGAGVTFGIKGVYSLEEMQRIEKRLTAAQRKFYNDYMRPIDITIQLVTMSTQEVRF